MDRPRALFLSWRFCGLHVRQGLRWAMQAHESSAAGCIIGSAYVHAWMRRCTHARGKAHEQLIRFIIYIYIYIYMHIYIYIYYHALQAEVLHKLHPVSIVYCALDSIPSASSHAQAHPCLYTCLRDRGHRETPTAEVPHLKACTHAARPAAGFGLKPSPSKYSTTWACASYMSFCTGMRSRHV